MEDENDLSSGSDKETEEEEDDDEDDIEIVTDKEKIQARKQKVFAITFCDYFLKNDTKNKCTNHIYNFFRRKRCR